jgi:uroporphyrinogen III methyltransferase/synthase
MTKDIGRVRDSSEERSILAGKRVVITRARSQGGELARRIEELGGEVIEFPTIEIVPPQDHGPLDRAIERLETYQWIFFTSVNGVEYFLARLDHFGKDATSMEGRKVVAIGPETGRRLDNAGIRPFLVPQKYQAEGILEGLAPEKIRGTRVLIPRAAQAREVLPETLRQWGGFVDVVPVYRTVAPKNDVTELTAMLRQNKVDVITFTSSSTVTHFVQLFHGENVAELVASTVIACIGPITGQTATDYGLRADIISEEYTVPGLVGAIVEYYQSRSQT